MADDEISFELRQIKSGDRLSGLKLGDQAFQPLKSFLQNHAQKYHLSELAKTYAAFASTAPDKAVAYITLVCGQVETQVQVGDQIGSDVSYTYDHCPAVKIARLAVDTRFKGNGLGQYLVDFALGLTREEIMPRIGCRFVIVDAKQTAVKFYQDKCGFTLINTVENKALPSPVMFMDLHKAAPQKLADAT
ncbi:GNAT family N-acetyltransferase [Devosia sp. J2-20]|uniref:GNAT family N-acetyltransferase n=1 Tax=Devosia sp. J2-20 TaxID=3026161 RepID=UPI00249C8E49|nr:GNAT family N-acetyltransferase [Devosia sp. J2-20]WDR00892.1 GNAT family N-acetyltransferase [Devosia sp. J2-20]